ncbi:MAG: hypothetical protein H6738_19035 [Alphaproteobacteria bacterium]|nr:hypothetical protein [Alphaproteobacteria bacterium]MCB9698884.1 hypothetical protein [Alphaproteobacteria bacterium]
MTPMSTALSEATPYATENPAELGLVHWRRGLRSAQAESRTTGKPLLVLFDEVPGCSTVKGFGRVALSHPLLADAAETLFVPLFVSNNEEGEDRDVLLQFGERPWDNPAVRFLSPQGRPVGSRLYGEWTAASLAEHMVEALGADAPPWLVLVAQEERAAAAGTVTETYGAWCFWQGEATLGAVPGVVGTRTGFLGGHEAVELVIDPSRLDRGALRHAVDALGAKPLQGELRPSPDDDNHALRGTPWSAVPMTEAQAARVNATVAAGGDPSPWLSPRQRALVR